MQTQPQLFNHNMLPVLSTMQSFFSSQSLMVFQYYSGRPLGITFSEDIIQLPEAIRPGWEWISNHYRKSGIEYTTNVVWCDLFDVAKEFPDHHLSPFLFGREVHEVRPNERWFKIVKAMNEKNVFIELCKNLGLPVPNTKTFQSCENFYYDGSFPVYLKTDVSASGFGVMFCNSKDELVANIKLARGPFQLQQPVNTDAAWLNLTYEIVNGEAKRITATRQVLKGFVHNGNQFPTGFTHDPWDITDVLMRYLINEGMEGVLGFDLAMTNEGPLLIECNPRFNGSVYPAKIAQKLSIKKWKAMNFETRVNCFSDLNLRDLEFNPATGKGAIVFNWGPLLSEQKIGILLAGDEDEQARLEVALQEIL